MKEKKKKKQTKDYDNISKYEMLNINVKKSSL